MRERPILFSSEMVRAILDGRKTQTRRVCKGDWSHAHPACPGGICGVYHNRDGTFTGKYLDCPYGGPGDRLWVRETWADVHPLRAEGRYSQPGRAGIPGPPPVAYRVIYRADGEGVPALYHGTYEHPYRTLTPNLKRPAGDWQEPFCWSPSIHMPRWASRITLEIVGVRVERVRDISQRDAAAEGVDYIPSAPAALDHRTAFAGLWNKLNAARGYGWDVNPWVWVVEFCRLEVR